MICGKLRIFNAHAEQERSELSGTGHFTGIQKPFTTYITANGEVQTNEEATMYVYDFDSFVTIRILEGYASSLVAWNALRRSVIFL